MTDGSGRGRELDRALVESLGTPVLIAYPPGVVGGLNHAAQELTGLDVAMGSPLSSLLESLRARFADSGQRVTRSPLEEGLAGREWRGEVIFSHRTTAAEKFVDVRVRPVRDSSGQVVAAVMTLHDLTELRRVEEEKEQFLSIVSHELRTPLTPLKALAQLLISRIRKAREQDRPVDMESFERNLTAIERQVDRMNRLVGDLLSVSRAERGRLKMDSAPFDLAHSVRETVERYEEAAREDGRHRFVVDAPTSLRINADEARVGQALMNLIGNAVKYSPRGGEVRVSLTQKDGSAVIVIADQGIGISPEDLPRLGGAFTRGTGRAETFAGMGIGLHVARLMAEAHGGSLSIESDGEDRGATMRMRLPI